MHVAIVTRFGTPEVLVTREAPDPVADPGEVVIDVAAADVLWVETMIRRGGGGKYFDVTPPYVPGGAVAGRVQAVGDGVDPGWFGRKVVARTGQHGGYAEQVAVPVAGLSIVPSHVSFIDYESWIADVVSGAGPGVGGVVMVAGRGGWVNRPRFTAGSPGPGMRIRRGWIGKSGCVGRSLSGWAW